MAISNKDGQILQHVVRYCNQIETTKKFFNLDKADFENNIDLPEVETINLRK